MELSRQEYPALLTAVSPTQAVNLLNDRVSYIGKLNSDIAGWLADRRRVEEAYAQGLRRLAGNRVQTAGSFGVFQTPWQGILNAVEGLAESHDTLARRIEIDIEKPLRDYTNKNREMQSISTMKGNLASLAKDFDEAQRKTDKLQGKGTKADTSKLSSALSGAQEAGAQWESQAPFVFESLQALDESRVNHLRDALTQLQTHEIDILERSRNASASTLELILNVNTAEEISAFVARNAEGGPTLQTPRRPGTASQQPLTPNTAPSLAPPTSMDDRRSEVSSLSGSARTPSRAADVPPAPDKRKSTFGGLKRLGTVMGRRNKEPASSAKAEKPPPPERKNRPSRNPLRRNSTLSDMHRIPSPNASAVELGDSSAAQAVHDTPRGTLSRTSSLNHADSQGQPNGEATRSTAPTVESFANGTASVPNTAVLQPSVQPRQMRPPSTILEEGGPSPLDEITRAQQEAAATEDPSQHLKVDIRNNPINEEDPASQTAAFSNVANALRSQAGPPPRKAGTIRGRRDVRNTIFVPSGATPESVLAQPGPSMFPSTSAGVGSIPEERAADAQSIRSAHSITSLGANVANRHPELTQPGLNASIIETVSTSFQQGQATKSMVTGEIALVYHGSSTSGKETVRLDNFSVLHKVAPNPQFIEQATGRNGEYILDLAAISRTQVGFKYQVHLEDNALGSLSPIVFNPVWRIEPAQASVILNYTWNPAITSNIERIVLTNVAISLNIEDAKASSCMSKPVGAFSKERGTIAWKLGEVVLQKSSAERLLARFTTNGEAKPGTVEARWEVTAEHATGLGSELGLSARSDELEKSRNSPDPFSDEGNSVSDTAAGYKPVAISRKLISGRYLAN